MWSTAIRLSVFYALVFSFLAIQLAYWPLWLKERGIADVLIGPLLAFGFVAKVVVNPLFRIAAACVDTRVALLSTLALALAVFGLFGVVSGPMALSLVQIVFLAFWVPVLPATESLALAGSRGGGFDYGRVRLWGSAAFLLTTILVGRWLEHRGVDAVFAMQFLLLAAIASTAAALPGDRRSDAPAARFFLRALWAVDGLPRLLVAAGLVQASHAMLYVFGSIHWKAIGMGGTAIGLFWAEGVVAEILVFVAAGRFHRRLSPAALIALGGAAACVRWLFMPAAMLPYEVAVLQVLHGATFGMTHLGAMRFFGTRVPEHLSANSVALYSMVVMGLFMGAAVFVSGWLFSGLGAQAFWCMAPAAACGGLLALTLAYDKTPHDREAVT